MRAERPARRGAAAHGAPILGLAVLAAGCSGAKADARQPPVAAKAATAQASPCTNFGVPPIVQQPVLTGNFSTFGDQIGANCMAWQSFIALNWRADPANRGLPDPTAQWANFGDPADDGPTVWESYWEASSVFTPPAAQKLVWSTAMPTVKRLVRDSKLDATNLTLSGFKQAGDHKWLTDQNGNLTYYEVRINEDEFDYIESNGLTTFAGQAACASNPGKGLKGGFNLPVGGGGVAGAVNDADCAGNARTYGQNVGAIEIKAAWRILPADGSLNFRYMTSKAQITDPYGQQTTATVGLVGLHIIRRVPGAAQFVWSTFEHVDNSPDESSSTGYSDPALPANPNLKPRSAYTYFNPACTLSSDPVYQCQHNRLPGKACPQGQSANCDPYSAPLQVTRITPVDLQANSVTGYVWSLLPQNSVFNYYRLVNVQWPTNSTPTKPGATVPLTTGNITPSANVANTTLETFLQASADSNNCMACHQYASIAQPSARQQALVAGKQRRKIQPLLKRRQGAAPPPASTYSFLFVTETRQ